MQAFKCRECNLRIEKDGNNFRFVMPGKAMPTKLSDFNPLKHAHKSGHCPVCGLEMDRKRETQEG